jgi:CcmD family protein
MMRLLRVGAIVAVLFASPMTTMAMQPEPPKGFVPADTIPPGEQIPAIRLVAAAYGFVWLAVFGYVFSIAKRLKTVETELSALESRKR